MSWSSGATPARDVTVPDQDRVGRQIHLGALLLFDPPGDDDIDVERFHQLVASRLHLVPRYRQLLVDTPLGLGTPQWFDDVEFDLAYHVRHAALPRPGTRQQLEEYAARVLSRELDRSKPLWELYVIEGLQDGGFAVLTKHHRALVDGIDGVALTTVLLDLTPEASDEIADPQPWRPELPPPRRQQALEEVQDLVRSPARIANSVQRVVSTPLTTARRLAEIGQGVVSVTATNLRGRSRTDSLRREPGLARRFVTTSTPLDDVRVVKNAFDTTVNDVLLAVIGDTVGRLLRSRGEPTDGKAIRAMVPVSVESDDERHLLGSQIVAVFVDVPVDQMDPVHRLRRVASSMADVKRSHHAVGAKFLVDLGSFAAPTIQAMAARLVADPALYDILITNIPGPQTPIWCLGARLAATYPYVPLVGLHAMSVGIGSSQGELHLAFNCDYDAVPEASRLTAHVHAAVRELVACGEAERHRRHRQADPEGRGLRLVPEE